MGQWSSIPRKKHSSIVLVRRSHGTRHAQRACGAATQAGRAAAQRHLRSWYDFLNLLLSTFNPSFLRRKGFVLRHEQLQFLRAEPAEGAQGLSADQQARPNAVPRRVRRQGRAAGAGRCCAAHDGAARSKSHLIRSFGGGRVPQYKDPDMGFASWMRFHPQGFTKCVLICPSLATPVHQLQHVAAPKNVSQMPVDAAGMTRSGSAAR